MILQDEGALVAAAGHRHATHLVYLGLLAMQHRARAGVGLAASDGSSVRGTHGAGLVRDVLRGRIIDDLDAAIAVGQLTGAPLLSDVLQGHGSAAPTDLVTVHAPIVRSWRGGRLAVAMSGRLTNGKALRQELLEHGRVFAGDSDVELLAALIGAEDGRTLVNRVVAVLHRLRGAFSLVVASEERIIAARDPRGYRPLCVGMLGGATVLASEDAVLRDLGADPIRPVAPGEVLVVDAQGVVSLRPFLDRPRSASLADLIDLARDDATVEGVSVLDARLAFGAAIARERPAPGAGLVVGLPGAEAVAHGYAQTLGRRLVPALSLAPASRSSSAPGA